MHARIMIAVLVNADGKHRHMFPDHRNPTLHILCFFVRCAAVIQAFVLFPCHDD